MLNRLVLYALTLLLVLAVTSAQSPAYAAWGNGAAEASDATEQPYFSNADLYLAGTEGYHTFRIPSLFATKNGTLLAFAEGRKNSASDTGDIDTVLKRSYDQGRTWQPLQIVCDAGADTCGNPTAVQDEGSGRIWLFMTQNYGTDTLQSIVNGTSRGVRTIWSSYSDDDGASWSQPVNRFNEVQPADTRWDATGPGVGIQLRHGPAKGRLVIPAIGRNIQSDDHGATWYQSGPLPSGTSEATVVELTDGTLLRNDRLSDHQEMKRRGISTSTDQGATWSPIAYDDALIDPICEGSISRYMPSDNTAGNRTVLFANDADTVRRDNMTVRISNDDGHTWTAAKTVYRANAAYSSLAILPDGKAGLLFEGGEYTAYDKIMLATFNLAWIATPEPDLDQLQFSTGSLSPVFYGDLSDYRLELYSGTKQLTVTPVTANPQIAITVNGQPAAAGLPKTVVTDGLQSLTVEAKLGQRMRQYRIQLDASRPRPELLLQYDFDRTNADGSVADTTGNGHSAVLNSGAELRPGMAGNALYLNGQRSSAQITHEDDIHTGTDGFTFSVWVNPEPFTRSRHIIYWYGVAGKYPQWWCSVESNGAARINMFGLPAGKEVGLATASGLVKPGVWTLLTFVRDGDVNKIYVNGDLAATSVKYDSASMNITNRTPPPLIGYDKGTAANRDFHGYMDDLKFYRYALFPAEVKALYWSGVDATKPITQAVASPGAPNGANGWYTSDVTVTLTATDELSGVARTEYRMGSGDWIDYEGPIIVSAEGANMLEYRSADYAGNVEHAKTLTILLDKTAPLLSLAANPSMLWPPNGKLTPIRMDVQAADDVSGVAGIKLVSITSSEAALETGGPNGGGEPDIQDAEYGADDREFLLRARRSGEGPGRVYTIDYSVSDQAGHVTNATAIVTVPHDQSK